MIYCILEISGIYKYNEEQKKVPALNMLIFQEQQH